MKYENFLNLDAIPTADKDPEFWGVITSPHFIRVVNFLIINEVRKYNVEGLTENACRTQLAKLKAMQELLDFPNALIVGGDGKDEMSDDIPDTYTEPQN